jgi:hypothetical protein
MNLLPPGMYGITYGSGCVYATSFSSPSRTRRFTMLLPLTANPRPTTSNNMNTLMGGGRASP